MTSLPNSFLRRPVVLVCGILAVVIVASGLFVRWSRAADLQQLAVTQGIPHVKLIAPTVVASTALELPARIEAWSRAPIYARVSGYLRQWNLDIGSNVGAGQILAEIETPDLDHELQQARSELLRAQSEAALAESTARRWQALSATAAVSKQETEERLGESQARRAQANALKANVDRLQTLQSFKRLVAPFDGVVTGRNTDVGSLINVGTNPGSELFVVSDIRRLRVYVDVPQRQVASIQRGGSAQLTVPERPGRVFLAKVQSLAQAIDVGTGTMRVQLSVENPDNVLLPGGFATVRFDDVGPLVERFGLPPSALIIGRGGVQVAAVDEHGRAMLRQVTISRDHGKMIELADAFGPDDRVINNPPDGLLTGDRLNVADDHTQVAAH